MEENKKCPYYKSVKKEKLQLSSHLIKTIIESNFSSCLKEECMAYDELDDTCKLIEKPK